MCKTYFHQQPICRCIYMSGIVDLCPLFTNLPENKHKNTFEPKLVTVHCQGLNLFFNGINYASFDVVKSDIVPNGLDCPEVNLYEEMNVVRQCSLCDSKGALKYLKVKGIEYKPYRGKAVRDLQREGAERGAEDAEEKDVEDVPVGMSVKRYELADRLGGLSTEKGRIENRPRHISEAMKRNKDRAVGKRVTSGLAESTSASMW